MLFSVGYRLRHDNLFCETVIRNRNKIGEIYFSFGDFANGRGKNIQNEEFTYIESNRKQIEDLKLLSKEGFNFNFLLNGNCYGKYAQSRSWFYKLGDTVSYLSEICRLTGVTTTSPLIAKFLKENFLDIEVRASVNMEIGTTDGMDYVADLFDSFYLKREYNRDYAKILSARKWCDKNGKKLYGLANSGCLNNCSAHTFHDNLVSHEAEIAEMDNAYQFEGQCWVFLKNGEKQTDWLRRTNFIRPEDIQLYEGLYDGIKLATRTNKNPARIIEAYCNASYSGSVQEILEPDHSALFYPSVIDNKKFSPEFTNRVLHCNKNCDECEYCANVQKNATVILK